MMYATPQDLITRFGDEEMVQLLKLDAADTSHPRLVMACEDAAALADSYIMQAAILPLAITPPALIAATADIARYRLHDDQIKEGGEGGKTTQRMRYEDAIRWLEAVASGKISLSNQQNGSNDIDTPFPLIGNHRIAVVSSPVVFTQDVLNKMDACK